MTTKEETSVMNEAETPTPEVVETAAPTHTPAAEYRELTVEERLRSLHHLQAIMSEVDKLKTLRGELPLEVQDLEDEIEGLNIREDKIRREIDDFSRAISQKRAEIAEAEASVERYNRQLDEVKNNREYDTLSKEIEFQTLEIELCNKKIKEALVKIDECERELGVTGQQIYDRERDLHQKRNELDEIMLETKEEEEKLRDRARDLETKIEPRLLSSFKRIRKNARNGLGIVYVQRDACGGCFNKIPPQRQLDVKMHKKVIVCEYCGRIIVDPEVAGVKNDKSAAAEKPKRKRAIRKTKEETE